MERARRSGSYIPPEKWKTISMLELLDGLRWFPNDPRKPNDYGPALNYAGDVNLVRRPCVAVVGTRAVSHTGAERARTVAHELAKAGIVVVSGLAKGVDTAALTAAIDAGGKVIAVIGTPLDKAYPAENKRLQEVIYQKHLLVSQFESGSTVQQRNFPMRNRVMATISDVTVIIEAGETSGTLHQASECNKLDRWLFIAREVVEDTRLTWPKNYLGKPRTRVLSSMEDLFKALRETGLL